MSTDGAERSVTVVVADGGPPTLRMYEVLDGWAAQNLLHDFLLVETKSWAAGKTTTASRISGGEPIDVNLLASIARGSYDVVRLLAVTVVGHDPVEPEELTLAGDRVAMLLQTYLAEGKQRLVRINLVVPSSEPSSLSKSLLRASWDVNVVASPEDRASDDQAAAMVTDHQGLYEHAALAAATAGALWAGMAEGPFDTRRQESGSGSPAAVVARSFARVVLGGGLIPRVLSRVFELRATSPLMVARAAGGRVAPHPADVVHRCTEVLLAEAGGGELNFTKSEPKVKAQTQATSLWRAVAAMFRFVYRRMMSHPREQAEKLQVRLTEGLERFVQRATYGADSTVSTTYRGLPRDGDGKRTVPPDAVGAARATAQHILAEMAATSAPHASPRLWRELRQVSFGLLDGGDLPSYAEFKAGDREIVTDPSYIAPVPAETTFRPEVPDFLRSHAAVRGGVRECDPAQATMLGDWLEEQRIALGADEGAAEKAALVDTAIEQLAEWRTRRENTLVWAVPARCLASLNAATASLTENLRLVASGPGTENTAAEDRAYRRMCRWWTFFAVLGALTVGWAVGSRVLGSPESAEPFRFGHHNVWALSAAGTAVAFLGWWVTFFLYQRRLFQLAGRFNKALAAYENAVYAAEHDAREVVRLASVYDQARDWGEIVAWMVHRPEGPSVPSERPDGTKVPQGCFAAGFAEGRSTPDSETTAGAKVANVVFARGWLTNLYEQYKVAILDRYQRGRGLDPKLTTADPDSDIADPSRLPVLKGLQDGTEAAEWQQDVRRHVEDQLAVTNPDDLFPEVRLSAGSGDRTITAAEFLADLLPGDPVSDLIHTGWSVLGLQNRGNRVAESNVWTPPASIRSAEQVRARSTTPVRSRTDAYCIQAVRVDLADPAPYEWLAGFGDGRGTRLDDGPDDTGPAPDPDVY